MTETITQSPNIHVSKKTKVAAGVTALMLGTSLAVVAKRGSSGEKMFQTDIPVPTANQPHMDHIVTTGDTEGSIASEFNVSGFDTLDYENMINEQLPKADQPTRTLRPGEDLRLPPATG